MTQKGHIFLHMAALGSIAASLAHVWAIFAGPKAYASLGAPPDVIASAELGTWYAPGITLGIATIIFGWALYAWSALGKLVRLPLLRTGLIAISAVLLLRGLLILPLMFLMPEQMSVFAYWSSALCFLLGACFAIGLISVWPQLRKKS